MEALAGANAVSFALEIGHYYFLRVLAAGCQTSATAVTVRCHFYPSERIQAFDVPVSSGKKEDHALPGKWMERYYIFFAGLQDARIEIAYECPLDVSLLASCHEWAILHLLTGKEPDATLLRDLRKAKSVEICYEGKRWPVFFGLDDLPLITRNFAAQANQCLYTVGKENLCLPIANKTLARAAIWADEPFASVLKENFSCTPITQLTVPLLETGFFNLAVVQERASRCYESVRRPLSWLAAAACPQCLLKPAKEGGTFIDLRGHERYSVYSGHEADFLRIVPSVRPAASLARIAVPCASDCFDDAYFFRTLADLARDGFHLTIFETAYAHHPESLKRLFGGQVPISTPHCRNLADGVAHFRSSAFALLCGTSVRNTADIAITACAALLSGALPIILGPPLPSHPFIDSFYSFEQCASFMLGFDELSYQRAWIRRFRTFMRYHLASDVQRLLLPHFGLHPAPHSAEILCVSKRPDKAVNIVANIQRQRYANLGAHIIWNVPKGEVDACKQRSQRLGLKNVRVSAIAEEYNIGACLNYGIGHSTADCWFKMDDDDYYGSHYIEDAMSYYALGGFDAVLRPAFFVSFADGSLYGRHAMWDRRLSSGHGVFGCGATLSARRGTVHTMFSTRARNSCDSEWQKALWRETERIYIGDPWNYCTRRTSTQGHTWHIADAKLKKDCVHLGRFNGAWLDAD